MERPTNSLLATYLKVLGLSAQDACDAAKVKRHYRQLALKYHPDKTQSKDCEQFKLIGQAYEYLRPLCQKTPQERKTRSSMRPPSTTTSPRKSARTTTEQHSESQRQPSNKPKSSQQQPPPPSGSQPRNKPASANTEPNTGANTPPQPDTYSHQHNPTTFSPRNFANLHLCDPNKSYFLWRPHLLPFSSYYHSDALGHITQTGLLDRLQRVVAEADSRAKAAAAKEEIGRGVVEALEHTGGHAVRMAELVGLGVEKRRLEVVGECLRGLWREHCGRAEVLRGVEI